MGDVVLQQIYKKLKLQKNNNTILDTKMISKDEKFNRKLCTGERW